VAIPVGEMIHDNQEVANYVLYQETTDTLVVSLAVHVDAVVAILDQVACLEAVYLTALQDVPYDH